MRIDTKRGFRSKQKSALLFKSNNNCAICNEPITENDEIEFNHIHGNLVDPTFLPLAESDPVNR